MGRVVHRYTHSQQVLDQLDADGGFTTGDVGERVCFRFGHNSRTHSAYVRQVLLQLERDGLVRRLDDKKPACWVKVA